jgi:uncharacterized protein YndB with AHSA1/START domain
MTEKPVDLSPIRRVVSVSWSPDAAFKRFTADFATWWPRYTHSIGGRRVKHVVLEPRVGGALYEEHYDGTRYAWGVVTAFDPPRRLAFTFHASYDAHDAQQVEVSFTPENAGTRVELVSSGWERMGDAARRSRGGYQVGWGAILDRYAGRFSAGELLFFAIAWGIDLAGQRGKFMRNSLGRIPPSGSGTPSERSP